MLTLRQKELLLFINRHIRNHGISPSFEEMKYALDLASKSGVHRLISALEERGFLRRLPNRARAIQILKLPDNAIPDPMQDLPPARTSRTTHKPASTIPIMGRIAAGVPASALQTEIGRLPTPETGMDENNHFALEISGDSMIDAGIMDGDIAILRYADDALSGDIVVALIDEGEASLKRLRIRKGTIALEAANPNYETRIFGPGRVRVQGKLVALLRHYE